MTKPPAELVFTYATPAEALPPPTPRRGTCPHCGAENIPLRFRKIQPHPVVRVGPNGHHATDEDCPGAYRRAAVES